MLYARALEPGNFLVKPPEWTAGCVFAMSFDEDTLSTKDGHNRVRDLTGQTQGGVIHDAELADGIAGEGLVLDGQAGHVALGNPDALRLTGDQTITLWIRPDSLGKRQNPFAKAYGGEGTMTLEADGKINYYYGTAGRNANPYQSFTMTEPVKVGEWTHVTLVRDLQNKQVTWYKNGVQTNRKPADHERAVASTLAAYLGKGYVKNFHGRIDEVAVFDRALSADEVKALHQMAGAGKSYCEPLGLAAPYWRRRRDAD